MDTDHATDSAEPSHVNIARAAYLEATWVVLAAVSLASVTLFGLVFIVCLLMGAAGRGDVAARLFIIAPAGVVASFFYQTWKAHKRAHRELDERYGLWDRAFLRRVLSALRADLKRNP